MEECISNIVVTEMDDNYVVQQVPISIMDASFESVGIAHLVHPGIQSHTSQVIRLTTEAQSKVTELHPLEAAVQHDLELKRRQHQEQIGRHNNSVIQTVSDSGRRTDTMVPVQHKPFQLCSDSMALHSDSLEVQHLVKQAEPMAVTHLYQSAKPMLIDGKQIIFLEGSAPVVGQQWDVERQPMTITDIATDVNDDIEMAQIPLTVQNYSHMEEVKTVTKDVKPEYDSEEDEDEEMDAVKDHEPDPEPGDATKVSMDEETKPNKCYVCLKSFRQKKNMYAHIRKIHSTQPKVEGGILCPLCHMYALRQEHLRNHLKALHNIQVEKEERMFSSMEEFQLWKEHIERDTASLYVSKSSTKLLANNQQKTYFKCHRSGNYVSEKGGKRKKRLKTQGSNKIGATCPAAMEVTENIHGVTVVFWKTHVGHSKDLEHLALGKEERARITEFLMSGIPWEEVLTRIKEESQKKSVVSRLSLISRQDLRNLKKNHDMKNYPELFPERKIVNQGRKPKEERMLRRASQALVVEKAEVLLNILETTDVIAEFRPKVCLMIDNLISTVKRRAKKNIYNRRSKHRRRQLAQNTNGTADSDDADDGDDSSCDGGSAPSVRTECQGTQTTETQDLPTVIKSPRKRARSKRRETSASATSRKTKNQKVN